MHPRHCAGLQLCTAQWQQWRKPMSPGEVMIFEVDITVSTVHILSTLTELLTRTFASSKRSPFVVEAASREL